MIDSACFNRSDLESFAKLNTPMWVFDTCNFCIHWANPSGLAFWHAPSITVLRQREVSNDSKYVKDRLAVVSSALQERGSYIDTWTLYPDNQPAQVQLQIHRIVLGTSTTNLLFEVIDKLSRPLEMGDLRMLEATRATSSMITMMSLDGNVLVQNPAAQKRYGPSLASSSYVTDLQWRFLSVHDVEHVHAVVSQNGISQMDAKVRTLNGTGTHSTTIQRGRDPVSGASTILLSEVDISETPNHTLSPKQEAGAMPETGDRLDGKNGRTDRVLAVAAIWDWDIAADKLYFSPNFIQLLEYEPAEFIQKLRTGRFQGIVHPGDYIDYQQVLADFLANPDKPISHEMRFATKSGDYLWIQIEGKCFCDDEGNPIRTTGLLTNITPKKQMEATLLASQKLEAIGQLTGGVAHDFNNLLTVILGNAQLLEERGTPDKKLTSEIVGAVERGAELTRHLLAFARKQSLNPEPVDINQLCTNMCATLFRILSETIAVVYEGQDGLWEAFADAAQIESALLNIALNARDAMPNGGTITILTKNVTAPVATPAILAPGDYINITISDTGTGMALDTRTKAFDPFFTTKGAGQGTGLGLSMVLGFSQQSGGTTEIDTLPGIGTTISVFLPRALEPKSERYVIAEAAPVSGQGEHVHILEDNEAVRLIVSDMILSLGYRVSTSGSVTEALSVADQNPDIDFFLVDVILPGGQSGVDFASELMKTNPKANLILVSGYPESQLMRDIAQTLDFVFLPKPFSRAQIAKALKEALYH
ncbi:MAG: ATP-binding protein [Granulosicoccus sp.]